MNWSVGVEYRSEFKICAAEIIRKQLVEKPHDITQLINIVRNQGVPYPFRATKEAAWQMAEDGEAIWADNWCLELAELK